MFVDFVLRHARCMCRIRLSSAACPALPYFSTFSLTTRYVIRVPYNVASHLKILIPVGTAMIIVADVKYARVSTSIPTVNM